MEKILFDELKKIVDLNESSDNLDNKCVAAILCTILGADLDNKLEELSLIVVANYSFSNLSSSRIFSST